MKGALGFNPTAENQRRQNEEEAKKIALQNTIAELTQKLGDSLGLIMTEIMQEGFTSRVRKYINKFAQQHDDYLAGRNPTTLVIQRADLERAVLDQFDALDAKSQTDVLFTIMHNWLNTHRAEAAVYDLSEMWSKGFRIGIEAKN